MLEAARQAGSQFDWVFNASSVPLSMRCGCGKFAFFPSSMLYFNICLVKGALGLTEVKITSGEPEQRDGN